MKNYQNIDELNNATISLFQSCKPAILRWQAKPNAVEKDTCIILIKHQCETLGLEIVRITNQLKKIVFKFQIMDKVSKGCMVVKNDQRFVAMRVPVK